MDGTQCGADSPIPFATALVHLWLATKLPSSYIGDCKRSVAAAGKSAHVRERAEVVDGQHRVVDSQRVLGRADLPDER